MIEEAEIVCILEKSKEVLKKYPELKEMNPKEALAYLTEKKWIMIIWAYFLIYI